MNIECLTRVGCGDWRGVDFVGFGVCSFGLF